VSATRLPSALLASLLLLGIEAPLPAQVVGTITVDPSLPAGTDGAGRLLLFAPNPVEPGSSISHWDLSARPDLLMEPNISSTLAPGDVDLTRQAMQDLGWSLGGGAVIQLNFTDAAGSGFNDPALGAERRNALRRAADVWQSVLSSTVAIVVDAKFSSLSCSPDDGATLAQAATNFVFRDFPGAPFAGTWFHGALAESISGVNLSQAEASGEITATFNSRIDQDCLGNGSRFFYGPGAAPSGEINFESVALHEIGHGLGFANFVDERSGQKFQGLPDVFTWLTRDNVLRKTWAELTADQIRASATRTGQVAWTGREVNRALRSKLDPSPVLAISGPGVDDTFLAGEAAFGPRVEADLLSAPMAAATDGTAQGSLACGPIANRAAVRGAIAVVDRGECLFVEKVGNAQDAGAVGVVVINNVPGLITMGGDDAGITIPAVMISQADGALLRAALAGGGGGSGGGGGGGGGGGEPEQEEPSECVPDDQTLCLNQGRFRVEVEFLTANAQGGRATAQTLTGDTGYFTFFDADNVEVVVKVLDACAFSNRFWVFAGGLTDVQVDLKVVDTDTGIVKTYANPLGSPFQPIQDTAAFATCP
jgi:hypothetical protein